MYNLYHMKNYFFDVLRVLIILFFLCPSAQAKDDKVIKLAIFDISYAETPLAPMASEYEKSYLQGIQAVAYTTKPYNLNIEQKFFMYGGGPLDILDSIPEINAWKPDIILGPSSSDQFLLLKNYLPNVLVLSSSASDINLKKMPKNFYSTFPSDENIMTLLSQFIKIKFPEKNIYLIEQVDCKQCIDASQLLISSYKKINPKAEVVENKIILDNIDAIDSGKLLAGHEDDAIVIFNSTYYAYNLLTKHIAQTFPKKNLIFFSDQDNWNNEVDGHRTYHFDLSYQSYRIGPILFDTSLPEFKTFSEAYVALYHKKPQTALSYTTYITLMSVIDAMRQYSCPDQKKSMREKILYSYTAALKENPNWFRKRAFGIYRLTSKGEVLVKNFPMSDLNH